MKKNIHIELNKTKYPMLFNIKNEEFNNICTKIFELGYNTYFPNVEKNKKINNANSLIISQNEKVISSLEKIDVAKLENILDDMFGISNNSSRKGQLTEDLIYAMLKARFKDYIIEETRTIPHHADGVIKIPADNGKINNILIEIKNYTKSVDTDEINKLIYDMKYTGIKYSIFISLKSGFIGKKQLSIQEFQIGADSYYILFVPNINGEFNKIEFGIILLERLMELNFSNKNNKNAWLEIRINDHLRNLDNIYESFLILKNKYYKFELEIKRNLSDFYNELRMYETEMKNKINNIWKEINNDLGKVKNELIDSNDNLDKIIMDFKNNVNNVINKNLIIIFELLKKYGLSTNINNGTNIWHITKKNVGNEELLLGSICKLNNHVQISINEPNFVIKINNKKLIEKQNINLLNTIFENLTF